jgi:hypothetical protein
LQPELTPSCCQPRHPALAGEQAEIALTFPCVEAMREIDRSLASSGFIMTHPGYNESSAMARALYFHGIPGLGFRRPTRTPPGAVELPIFIK